MRKSKIIAIVLAVSVMLMGAGYAAWNEAITVTNNVSTGELKVEFDNVRDMPNLISYPKADGINPNESLLWRLANGFSNSTEFCDATITHGAKVTTVTINNLYPGSVAMLETKIKNKGTIPAKFNAVTINLDAVPQVLRDDIRVYGKILKWTPGKLLPEVVGSFMPTVDINPSNIFDVTINGGVKLSELEATLNQKMAGLVLLKDQYITFDVEEEDKATLEQAFPGYDPAGESNCLFFYLRKGSTNASQSLSTTFDIAIDFKQFNQ